MELSQEVILLRNDDKLVKDILKEEFGFEAKHGEEFQALPTQLKELTFMIERKGMDFKIARANFDSACRHSKKFIFAAHRVVFEGKAATPLGYEMWNVEAFFRAVLILKADIENLINIYNAQD